MTLRHSCRSCFEIPLILTVAVCTRLLVNRDTFTNQIENYIEKYR